MLVCPHCQFENPVAHKFCQHCGTSLTEKACEVCGAPIAFSSEYCLQCGAVTGTTWKAILSPVGSEASSTELSVALSDLLDPATSDAAILLPTGKFLDSQQRYRLLEPLPQQIAVTTEAEVRVLDNQPLQKTLLSCYQQAESTVDELEQIENAVIPELAQSYLNLQAQHPFLPLPQLHDAWQQAGLNVLLLEDRSHLPLLVDLWVDENILPLQILHWLHQMTELWAALETQRCCHSLFELSNLRVDEDYLLCLQRLYADPPQQPALLIHLGAFWQKLFQQSQRTQHPELVRLCAELDAGIISSLSQLRFRIEAIAAVLQSDQPSPSMTSAIPYPNDPQVPSAQGFSAETMPMAKAASSTRHTPSGEEQAEAPPIHPPSDDLEVADTQGFEIDEGVTETDDVPTVVLAMRLASLEDAGRTDIGRQRDHNEDCFSVQTEIKKIESPQGRIVHAKGLYVLCDGMGGHASGEVASAMAVETLQQYFAEHWQDRLPSEEKIREAIQQANRAIFDQNQKNASAGSGRMGTTLVLLLLQDTQAAIAHVGDSRLYRLSRRRGLQQLTVDHEVGQREIQRGVEPGMAYARPDAYQLTQALGPRDENFLNPEVKFFELNEDGILLLCSDGLSDNDLLETHWQSHLEPMLDQRMNLEQGVNQLIDLANQYNGHDNITAIAVRMKVRPNLDQVPR